MTSIAEALVAQLKARGVATVFGIPGVHTVELYRGLEGSGIRHVTPRHEQGAGFMADGYARASGRPGVAFVITGPGLTNTLTPMAQARADSVPMLVVSGVNARPSLGKGLGHLHELPDQQAVARGVALVSEQVGQAGDLSPALDRAFACFEGGRPGPAHVELPLDVAGAPYDAAPGQPARPAAPVPGAAEMAEAAARLRAAKAPVILVGGGARGAAASLRALAERLGAPVVQTVNARGVIHGHPLGVPASPSLQAVRDLIAGADAVLAVGTELGPTDYDMYERGDLPEMAGLIRVDICPQQLARRDAALSLNGDAVATLEALNAALADVGSLEANGAARAAGARQAARAEIGPQMRALCDMLEAMRDAVPDALIVGDSTQAVYAGNLYYDHDRRGGWFNSATGYGALGYAIPAAVGAALGAPGADVIALTGDGGAQFTLPEMMVAVEEKLPVTFVIWNNLGYREIETAMREAGVAVVGCDPVPPDFEAVARSCGMPFTRCAPGPQDVAAALRAARRGDGPAMVEVDAR